MRSFKHITSGKVVSEAIDCKIHTDEGLVDGVVFYYGKKGVTQVMATSQFRKAHVRILVTKSSAN